MSPKAQLLALVWLGNSTGLLGTSQSLFSWTYMVQASCNCFRLLRQTMACALALARARAGKSKAARIARMAMTTKSSIRVKAEADPVFAAPGRKARGSTDSIAFLNLALPIPAASVRLPAQTAAGAVWARRATPARSFTDRRKRRGPWSDVPKHTSSPGCRWQRHILAERLGRA